MGTSSPERAPSEVDFDDVLKMTSSIFAFNRGEISEDSSPGKVTWDPSFYCARWTADSFKQRPADETSYSGIKRIKRIESQPSTDSDDTGSYIVVSPKTGGDQDDRGPRVTDLESPPPLCASRSPSPRMNITSEPSPKVLDSEINMVGRADKTPHSMEAMDAASAHYNVHPEGQRTAAERGFPSPSPALLSRPLSDNHGAIQNSNPSHEQPKRPSLFGSEYSISLQSDEPQSPDLTTPTSGPEAASSDTGSATLSPRSRTSSLVPFQLHSGERKQTASSSTGQTQRTPLPTKKESNSTRDHFGTSQETRQDMHGTRTLPPLSQVRWMGSPREHLLIQRTYV